MEEFAANGYEKASTNQIVKNAGIGKGMLFYYFQNKKELYNYLVDYCLDVTTTEFINRMDTSEPDFIERLKYIARIKTDYHLKHPNVLNFLGSVFINEGGLPDNFKKRHAEIMMLGNSKLYDNIDTSLFGNDIDTEKAFKLIQWSMEGYQNELIARLKSQSLATVNFDPYWDEFYDYIEVLKTVYYK